jgi:hypothetical protein
MLACPPTPRKRKSPVRSASVGALADMYSPKRKKCAPGATLDRTVSALDLSCPGTPPPVFELAPGLPGDVRFGAGDGPTEFLLHAWMLKLRSPVLAALLDGQQDDADSLAPGPLFIAHLPESNADLKLFFRALYSNAPQSLITVHNVVALTRVAHKYGSAELESLCWAIISSKLIKQAKWVGSTPSLPALLLLGQQCSNDCVLQMVLAAPNMRAFAPPAPLPPLMCALHPYETVPCHYKTPGCGASELAMASALADSTGATPSESTALLRQLSPHALVSLIGVLAAFVPTVSLPLAPRQIKNNKYVAKSTCFLR